jgi:hypothetical protein
MGRLSTFYAGKALDLIFGLDTNTFPTTLYIGLSSTQPADDGTNVTEPVGNNYGRVSVLNNLTNWPAASARAKSNGEDILFPAATGDWGDLGWFVIYDAPTAGNFVAWGELVSVTNITIGAQAAFITGTLIINAPGT